jgi:hypothetical protein
LCSRPISMIKYTNLCFSSPWIFSSAMERCKITPNTSQTFWIWSSEYETGLLKTRVVFLLGIFRRAPCPLKKKIYLKKIY